MSSEIDKTRMKLIFLLFEDLRRAYAWHYTYTGCLTSIWTTWARLSTLCSGNKNRAHILDIN